MSQSTTLSQSGSGGSDSTASLGNLQSVGPSNQSVSAMSTTQSGSPQQASQGQGQQTQQNSQPSKLTSSTTGSTIDLLQYVGKWHAALFNRKATMLAKCAVDEVHLTENGTISLIHHEIQRKDGIKISIPNILHVADPAEPAKMTHRGLNSLSVTNYWILETDYDSFTFSYGCRNVGSQHVRAAMYHTRDQKASDALIQKGIEFLEKYNFRKAEFGRGKQEDCGLTASK